MIRRWWESRQAKRKIGVPGLDAVVSKDDTPHAGVEILEAMKQNKVPWDAPGLLFLLHEHDGEYHPTVMIPLMGAPMNTETGEMGDIRPISIEEAGRALPKSPPPDPIVAAALVVEMYIGQRDGDPPKLGEDYVRPGDLPGDKEARAVIVVFAGGGRQRAIHFRESDVIGVWGKPDGESHPFLTAPEQDSDDDICQDLERLLVRINQGVPE